MQNLCTRRSIGLGRNALKGILSAIFVTSLLAAATLPFASATFPGKNGKIAFASDRDGNYEIYVMNSDGNGQTRLTNNSAVDFLPDWGPQPIAPKQASIIVESVDQSGNPLLGKYAVIRSASAEGTILKTGFTPLTFTGDTGAEYNVSVANYDGEIFKHWEDGSTGNTHTIHLSADTTKTATYDRGNSQSGFTPLIHTGAMNQPTLTVNATATTIGGSLRMWTIIDPQPSSTSAGAATSTNTYKVYATDGY